MKLAPPPRTQRERAIERDAATLEKIADELAAVVRMMTINERVRRGEVGVRAWEGDFVRREADAAMAAWNAYQESRHRPGGGMH